MISQVSAFLSLLVASAAAGEDLQTLIEEALDQPVQLEIQDMPLDRAFETIATETGVVLTTAAEALDLLPYGANTEVTARMKNISLREGLSRLTVPLGLRFEVRDRGIEVLPTPALVRIGRRAKWDELDTLAWLHGLEFSKDRPPVDELGERLQFRVGEIDGWPPLRKAVQRVGAGPGDQVLTLADLVPGRRTDRRAALCRPDTSRTESSGLDSRASSQADRRATGARPTGRRTDPR
ncbi:MAG: hypothetical protein ACYSVY_03935 [Planctomycetota bacterium]|jgi:hypothetical protein